MFSSVVRQSVKVLSSKRAVEIITSTSRSYAINSIAFGSKTGVVKFFDPVKGFGFITPDDGTEDVFVHQQNINFSGFRSLNDGEQVEYDIQINEDRGGKKFAANVTGPDGGVPEGCQRKGPGRGGNSDGGRGGGGGGRDGGFSRGGRSNDRSGGRRGGDDY
eukprot:gene24536-32998_t